MSFIFGSLAQVAPAATTLTDAYTCPAAKRATVLVIACNTGVSGEVRVSIAPSGAADAITQYILRDYPVTATDTISAQKVTLTAGDVVRVYSTTGAITFNINGIEEAT
jgi:hypothetical protein